MSNPRQRKLVKRFTHVIGDRETATYYEDGHGTRVGSGSVVFDDRRSGAA